MREGKVVSVIVYAMFVQLFSFLLAGFLGAELPEVIMVESIGLPTMEKQLEARKINDLRIFDGRLYLGHGDAVVNTGPTDVMYYDLEYGEFRTEFTVDDEAIYRYEVVDGKLVIPGPDATEEWDWGNIYVLDTEGWVKLRTIPNGIHINDVESHDDSWYTSTGCFFQFDDQKGETYPFGGIFRSGDAGRSWKLAYATPYDEGSVYRVNSLISFRGRLFGFYYSLLTYTREDIPVEYHASLGDGYGGGYVILSHDLFGPRDVIVFDGTSWTLSDLVPEEQVCTISPVVFGDRLVLSVLSGEYLDYFQLRTRRPEQARSRLYVYDGEVTKPVGLEYDYIRDILVKESSLYLLLSHEGRTSIVETADLVSWKHHRLPGSLEKIRCIERHEETLYIGMEDGNIFRSLTKPGSTGPFSMFPRTFYGVAELPAEGKWYWAAITGWQQWAEPATLEGTIGQDNLLDLFVTNASDLLVFAPWPKPVPDTAPDQAAPTRLRINDQDVFKGRLDQDTSLKCTLKKNGKWKAKSVKISIDDYVVEQKIVGATDITLTCRGLDATYGTWKAEVIRQAVHADIALVSGRSILGDLKAGPIALEDIYRTNLAQVICTFALSGSELTSLLEYNIKLAGEDRLHIAGFTMSYADHGEHRLNVLEQVSLIDDKQYRVAVSDGLMRYATNCFGQTIPHETTKVKVRSALFEWLQNRKRITLPAKNIFTTGHLESSGAEK